ncbi:hypothetical protein ACFSCV_04335 [Methylopila henanensis]|uniref:Nucleotidyltransferase n=1 Tax=Methylopila henanensis TaxID=873516 RepID=A0ABW4K2J7_9HYPH
MPHDEAFGSPLYFARVARTIARRGSLTPQQDADFAQAVWRMSFIAQKRDEGRWLEAHKVYIGYLTNFINSKEIFVPFYLACVFPGRAVLEDAMTIADAIVLEPGHALCLSGSTTFLGRLASGSDLDFCEYYTSAADGICAAIETKSGGSGPIWLTSFKAGGEPIRVPSRGHAARIATALADCPPDRPAQRFKLNFVSIFGSFGDMPVTSVVLPMAADDPEGGNAEHSFAFQEAVISGAAPGRSLLNAAAFARYALWLKNEVRVWCDEPERKAPLKSLKRALSVFLLLGYPLDHSHYGGETSEDLVDVILARLNAREMIWLANSLRIHDLRMQVADFDDETFDGLRSRLDVEAEEQLDAADVDGMLAGVREIAEALMLILNDLFDRAGELP